MCLYGIEEDELSQDVVVAFPHGRDEHVPKPARFRNVTREQG